MKFDTIKEAAQEWVKEFDAVPMGVVEKLIKSQESEDEIVEITPPCLYDRVEIYADEYCGHSGEIIQTQYDGESDLYLVKLDNPATDEDGAEVDEVVVSSNSFDVERDDFLPMWGTMWSPPQIDQDWIVGNYCEPHLQEVADCGFRIYEQEDYGILIGIDGAGYDFYESHWIPMYKKRGLHWHNEDGK